MLLLSLLAIATSALATEPLYSTSLNGCSWDPTLKVEKQGQSYIVSPSPGLTIEYSSKKKIARVVDTDAHTLAIFLYGEKSVHPDSVIVSNTETHNPLRKTEYDAKTGRLKQLTDYVTFKKWLTGMVYNIDEKWNGQGKYQSKEDPTPLNVNGTYDSKFEENGGKFVRNIVIPEPLNVITNNCYPVAGMRYPLRWVSLGTGSPTVDATVREPHPNDPRIAPGVAGPVPSLNLPPREFTIQRKGNKLITPDGVVTIEEGSGSDDESDDSDETSVRVGK